MAQMPMQNASHRSKISKVFTGWVGLNKMEEHIIPSEITRVMHVKVCGFRKDNRVIRVPCHTFFQRSWHLQMRMEMKLTTE